MFWCGGAYSFFLLALEAYQAEQTLQVSMLCNIACQTLWPKFFLRRERRLRYTKAFGEGEFVIFCIRGEWGNCIAVNSQESWLTASMGDARFSQHLCSHEPTSCRNQPDYFLCSTKSSLTKISRKSFLLSDEKGSMF